MIQEVFKCFLKPYIKTKEFCSSKREHLSSPVDPLSPLSRDYEDVFGVPNKLLPYFVAYLFDSIAIGLVMPLLPFTLMELGADAFQLSLVVSSNYVAQSIGCIVMGKVSDLYGRRVVMTLCLLASAVSYCFLSRATTLLGFALARIISGSFGGLTPVMQSVVADVSTSNDRPKYLGRIMATFGLGFVLGPMIASLLSSFSTRDKIFFASVLPFLGFLLVLLTGTETKKSLRRRLPNELSSPSKDTVHTGNASSNRYNSSPGSPVPTATSWEVFLLTLNGFALMYTFASETIYAMFIKDIFGYGEHTLSKLFAINGSLIGIFQIFFIKPMITYAGKHNTLAIGNLMLSLGMIGVALIRFPLIHFILFGIHILGYSIADTSLASLITKYSTSNNQGSDLALNQAAQAIARVFSPVFAGLLYEYSKKGGQILPIGALPFIASALLPATAVIIPLYLKFLQNSNRQKDKTYEMTAQYEESNGYDDELEENRNLLQRENIINMHNNQNYNNTPTSNEKKKIIEPSGGNNNNLSRVGSHSESENVNSP
jgi:MFS family permease